MNFLNLKRFIVSLIVMSSPAAFAFSVGAIKNVIIESSGVRLTKISGKLSCYGEGLGQMIIRSSVKRLPGTLTPLGDDQYNVNISGGSIIHLNPLIPSRSCHYSLFVVGIDSSGKVRMGSFAAYSSFSDRMSPTKKVKQVLENSVFEIASDGWIRPSY